MKSSLNRLALLMAAAAVATAGCGSGDDSAPIADPDPVPGPPTPPPPPPASPPPPATPTPPTGEQRAAAATATAKSTTNPCASVAPFYWEIGNATAKLVGESVSGTASDTEYKADTELPVASASKWIYGAYVAQKKVGVLTASDIQFLTFKSGYSNMQDPASCDSSGTVASCTAEPNPDPDGLLGPEVALPGLKGDLASPSTVGFFYYNSGHMQVHASNADIGLGALNSEQLTTEMRSVLGGGFTTFFYNQPQLAGGVRTTAADYAIFLRRILDGSLKINGLLGTNAVCTSVDPGKCTESKFTPIDAAEAWHYSIGHWVEDDPVVGDGAFSSPGAFGFYPWIDKDKVYYGVLSRQVLQGYNESVQCGRLIRKAYATGVAQ